MKRFFIIAITIFIIHFLLQFVAWSIAPGNTAFNQTSRFWSSLWPVFSFPVFFIVPQEWSNSYFGLVSFANSIIWAIGLPSLLMFFKKN